MDCEKRHSGLRKMITAECTVDEAVRHTRALVEYEKSRCGGDTRTALYRVTAIWGIDSGAVRQLWEKGRKLTFIKAHILESLRQANHVIAAAAERQRTALEETARVLEERNDPAAWLARHVAEIAGKPEKVADQPRSAKEALSE